MTPRDLTLQIYLLTCIFCCMVAGGVLYACFGPKPPAPSETVTACQGAKGVLVQGAHGELLCINRAALAADA